MTRITITSLLITASLTTLVAQSKSQIEQEQNIRNRIDQFVDAINTANPDVFTFLTSTQIKAQERSLNKLSIGFQLQQVQNELGIGVHLLSPSIGHFRLKSAYSYSWFLHEKVDGISDWTKYSNLNFGTRYQCITHNVTNLYVELGSQLLFIDESISSESMNFGGYGLIGFEFFLHKDPSVSTSYFIELGASANNSRADRITSQPKVGHGFITTVGVRF